MALVSVLAGAGLIALNPVPASRSVELIGAIGTSILIALALFAAGDRVLTRTLRMSAGDVTTDPLTGLAAAHIGTLVLANEFAAAQRGRPLSVVLFRIDSFPKYASKNGREAAERMLRSAGRILKKHTRDMHTTAVHRGGSATYVSVLSGIPVQGACVFAKRARRELLSLPGGGEVHSISVGIVPFDLSVASPAELLETAERALSRGTAAGGKIVALGLPVGATTD